MILSNLLIHIADWLKRNRATVIKWLLILGAIIIGAWLIYYGVERIHAWRFEKKVEAIDKRIQEKEAEIKAVEAYINALKAEIRAKDALLDELDKQQAAAKVVYGKTKIEYVYLKGEYEKTRDNPDVPIDISHCGACAELARAGHACK